MTNSFAAAFADGEPASFVRQCLAQLPGPDEGGTLGIIYISEPAAPMLGSLVRELAAGTGIGSWVGGVGLGVCAVGQEVYDRPAVAVMTAAVPRDSFRLFGATDDPATDLPRQHARWIETAQPTLALVHADPRCTDLMQAAIDTASASGAFLVGGLVSHRCAAPLVAGGAGADALGKAGISGLLLGPEVAVATALTQGCVPIGPVRRVDEALARDPRALGGVIFAGLPVPGSDTGDYLVRNLLAIDPRQGWIVLGAEVAPGEPILFCRRDPDSARADLVRMLKQLSGRLAGPPKAGIYVSCIARGTALFGEPGVETGLIRETLGDFPLIGFFANGEISRDRLYGHTGVLTLFT